MDNHTLQTYRTQGNSLLVPSMLVIVSMLLLCAEGRFVPDAVLPGARSLMDAHNCYPYFEWWPDRIDRALSSGTPLAIEQDLRSEEHTSELQSRLHLVCRLLLEKKKDAVAQLLLWPWRYSTSPQPAKDPQSAPAN